MTSYFLHHTLSLHRSDSPPPPLCGRIKKRERHILSAICLAIIALTSQSTRLRTNTLIHRCVRSFVPPRKPKCVWVCLCEDENCVRVWRQHVCACLLGGEAASVAAENKQALHCDWVAYEGESFMWSQMEWKEHVRTITRCQITNSERKRTLHLAMHLWRRTHLSAGIGLVRRQVS